MLPDFNHAPLSPWCFHHPDRTASARCPECGRAYCRECVTEHAGRVICAVCLERHSAGPRQPWRLRAAMLGAQCACAFLLLWVVFYALGTWLLRLPSSVHAGLLWEKPETEAH